LVIKCLKNDKQTENGRSPNERFGATAAGRADLKGSARIRRCAKPPSRYASAGSKKSNRQFLRISTFGEK